MKQVSIFSKFFGRKPAQTLADFAKELKTLSAEEKDELATLAAIELGVEYEKSEAQTDVRT